MRIAPARVTGEVGLFVRRVLSLMGALFALLPSAALADCPDGGRDATAHEKETAIRVLTALRESFPPPPGWKVTRDTSPQAPRTFCKGTTVLRLSFERRLTRVEGMTERRAAHDRALAQARRLTPDEQEQVKAVDQQIADASKQMGAARSALKNRGLDKDAPDAFFEGTTAFLIGHARARSSGPPGSLEPLIDASDPGKPRTFSVSIQADEDRALQMARAANESLRALTR